MIYKNLRKVREEKGYTQQNIADILGMAKPQYHLYESGKREIPSHILKRLASLYKVSSDYLLGVNYDYEENAAFEDMVNEALENYNKLLDLYEEVTEEQKHELSIMISRIKSNAFMLMVDSQRYVHMSEEHKENPEKIPKEPITPFDI